MSVKPFPVRMSLASWKRMQGHGANMGPRGSTLLSGSTISGAGAQRSAALRSAPRAAQQPRQPVRIVLSSRQGPAHQPKAPKRKHRLSTHRPRPVQLVVGSDNKPAMSCGALPIVRDKARLDPYRRMSSAAYHGGISNGVPAVSGADELRPPLGPWDDELGSLDAFSRSIVLEPGARLGTSPARLVASSTESLTPSRLEAVRPTRRNGRSGWASTAAAQTTRAATFGDQESSLCDASILPGDQEAEGGSLGSPFGDSMLSDTGGSTLHGRRSPTSRAPVAGFGGGSPRDMTERGLLSSLRSVRGTPTPTSNPVSPWAGIDSQAHPSAGSPEWQPMSEHVMDDLAGSSVFGDEAGAGARRHGRAQRSSPPAAMLVRQARRSRGKHHLLRPAPRRRTVPVSVPPSEAASVPALGLMTRGLGPVTSPVVIRPSRQRRVLAGLQARPVPAKLSVRENAADLAVSAHSGAVHAIRQPSNGRTSLAGRQKRGGGYKRAAPNHRPVRPLGTRQPKQELRITATKA